MKKKVAFVSDFFSNDLLGGAENNDENLINSLSSTCDVKRFYSKSITPEDLSQVDSVIVSNYVTLNSESYSYIIHEKQYMIYEHDHKYVSTRDPSVFHDFLAPSNNIVNKEFYERATHVVVLSDICKKVLLRNIKKANVHNIGCSLWSNATFGELRQNCLIQKNRDLCIMKSLNPTKNYHKTIKYCNDNSLQYEEIYSPVYKDFLLQLAQYKRFLFIPKVLETYSRICAEAKMMNVDVMTNKKMIGFFSEPYSNLKGEDLIDCIEDKNRSAYEFFARNI